VLGGALDAGAERVVITSSIASIGADGKGLGRTLTEEDWTDPQHPGVTPYAQSKTIAERAAWDLARERGAEDRLAAINPGAIIGPVLNADTSFSVELVIRLMNGVPGTPRIGYSCVDVRDVADLQIRAMLAEEAGGKRFIAIERFQWMADVAAVLRERLGPEAKKVPTRSVPDFLVKVMGVFDPSVRSVTGQLGREQSYSNERARTLLGWEPRPIPETIVETARSLIDTGVVKA
jgi:nucleoside-diphosphate-sugar epimerase